MQKTHKILIKNKFHCSLIEIEAKSMFQRLIGTEIKIKIFDKDKSIFLYPFVSDVVLQELDSFEKIIENTNLNKNQKNNIYFIIKSREDERKRINENIIENIINEILRLDENN